MDVCTLLPQVPPNAAFGNGLMGKSLTEMGLIANIDYLNAKAAAMSCNGASTISDDRCDGSRNSTTTTTSGSNSTTSSKIKLTSSPTDSLVKQPNCHSIHPSTTVSNCPCCTANNADVLSLDDYENNAYQISKLINERKTCVCPPKSFLKKIHHQNEHLNCELYSFNIFKSGGFVDIPKYCEKNLLFFFLNQNI